MLYRYFLMAAAVAAALVGVQIPNFLTQYQQRLDAQYSEAMVYYEQYEALAAQHFGGDLQRLVEHFQQQPDTVVQQGATPIATLIERVERFRYQQQGLNQSYLRQLWFVLTEHDAELRDATWRLYSSNVPFSQQALLTGASVALLWVLLLDLCCSGCARLLRRASGRLASRETPRQTRGRAS